MIRNFLAAALLACLPWPAVSINYFVRPGAAGSGSGLDWYNAFPSLPATLVRGATYYLADGVYGPYNFDDPVDADKYITILKATVDNHGTDFYWSDDYGDGVAVFAGTLRFMTDRWVFDGQVGELDAGHGFMITTTDCGSPVKLVYVGNGTSGASYVTISHTELRHCGEDTGTTDQDCLYVNNLTATSNLTVSYCYLHDVNRVMMLLNGLSNSTIEHNLFARRYTSGSIPHGEGISINASGPAANVTLRYNIFRDILGTGFIVIKDSPQGGFRIYGNVFYQTSGRYLTSNGALATTTGYPVSDTFVMNNTFVNLHGDGGIYWDTGSNNYAYNNLWVNSENVNLTSMVHDYNSFYNSGGKHGELNGSTELPSFLSYTSNDFQLARSTSAGLTLPSPFDFDPTGKARGADGRWDRGAYEFDGFQSLPPRRLRIK